MSASIRIAGLGLVDEGGLVGTACEARSFEQGGIAKARWKSLFPLPNPAYRHLDLFGRCVCIASEAAGVGRALADELRRDTALVLATRHGCLESDLHFAAGLAPGERVSPAVFPYTLPSTCLGELAIRHRLQGPLLCLMRGDDSLQATRKSGLREARRLLERGEARAAVVCIGDCLTAERGAQVDLPERIGVASVVLVAGGPEVPELDGGDPRLAALLAVVREEVAAS